MAKRGRKCDGKPKDEVLAFAVTTEQKAEILKDKPAQMSDSKWCLRLVLLGLRQGEEGGR